MFAPGIKTIAKALDTSESIVIGAQSGFVVSTIEIFVKHA